MIKRRVYDEAFKGMARAGGPVELSYAKGSNQDAARELGIDPGRIRKWRRSAAHIFVLIGGCPKKCNF
jgi:transposase